MSGQTGRALRINVGCGVETIRGFVNLDIRPIPAIEVRGDVLRLPWADESVAEARACSLLEHFADPSGPLDELHRVLRPDGRLVVRVPALGTNAAHLDPTHRYLADLVHWRQLLLSYFERVGVSSVGVKYRANRGLVALQRLMISVLGFHELGQCWVLTATRKRARREPVFRPWWAEPAPERLQPARL
jgi:SAM-dependent methyltransferase